MSAISTVIIKDGATTPADHTFVPFNPQTGNSVSAVWYDKTSGVSAGYKKLTMLVTRNSANVNKVRISIADPTLAVPGAACCTDGVSAAVAYTDLVNIEFSMPSSATLTNRADILAYAKNFLAHAVVKSAVVDLEMAW